MVTSLTEEKDKYMELLEAEKKKRRQLEKEVNSRHASPSGRHEMAFETEKKWMKDASVGITIPTRDIGICHVQTRTR